MSTDDDDDDMSTTENNTNIEVEQEQEANADEEKGDADEGALKNPSCCSLYVTGPQTTYQAIFVCDTCCETNSKAGLCVCEACANHCHEWHDELNYIGMGNAYCDCAQLGPCKLQEASQRIVQEWKLAPPTSVQPMRAPEPLPDTTTTTAATRQPPYIMNAFLIPELYKDGTACSRLMEEATELVQHSKETFWLSRNNPSAIDNSNGCYLERMAWRIFEQNRHAFGLEMQESGGAEWWVQVKETLEADEEETKEKEEINGAEAVDLHYDKDEALAEKFGLGAFPTLSTVTYLTEGSNPTIIFERTYEQEDDEVIPSMLVSHPKRGKHLVFDGRLLHGAPSHPDLRNSYRPSETNEPSTTTNNINTVRVTLLVNIWANRKPAGVNPLPPQVRKAILEKQSNNNQEDLQDELPPTSSDFLKQSIEEVVLREDEIVLRDDTKPTDDNKEDEDENDDKDPLSRITLPFVCKGITWESEDDESSGLVVVTCPPPEHSNDTVYVPFGAGLQAYLEQQYEEETYGEDPALIGTSAYQDAYL